MLGKYLTGVEDVGVVSAEEEEEVEGDVQQPMARLQIIAPERSLTSSWMNT